METPQNSSQISFVRQNPGWGRIPFLKSDLEDYPE